MKFYESFSETTRRDWPEIYQALTGKKWEVPSGRGITCETKIEDISEIEKMMKESPNYSVDVQGRV